MNLESIFSNNFPKVEKKHFTDDQIKLLEERRVSDWLHANIKSSITERSVDHDKEMTEKMKSLGLTEDDYDFFKENNSEFDTTDKNK